MGKHVENMRKRKESQKERVQAHKEQITERMEARKEHISEQHEVYKEQLNEQAEQLKRRIETSGIKEVKKNTYSFKRLFHAAFNLSADQADYDEINERIESGVVLRGTNMCILILAIFIASVGLNMNSTAVIIGAMLVSPLMGPIMGIGFSIANYDTNLLKRSATILLFEVIVALATSTIYFSLTPITTAGSELLARTSPAIWDVIIAVCGGLAGMIGTTRKEKSNILPGVAIATALMPPLCTAGYGLAMGNLRYFAGAMYLFSINGIFIAISTMLITVFLRLPSKNKANEETKKQMVKRVIIVAVVAIVPSLFLAADMVRDSVFDSNVANYVNQEFQFENTQVVKYSVDDEKKELKVAVIGTTLSADTIAGLERNMKTYHIDSLALKVQQTEVKAGITTDELESYVKTETSQLTAENEEEYQELQSQMISVKTELAAYQEKEIDVAAIKEEMAALYPEVKELSAGYMKTPVAESGLEKEEYSENAIVVLEAANMIEQPEMKKLSAWLSKRLGVESIVLYQDVNGVLYSSDYVEPKPSEKAGLNSGEKTDGAEKEAEEALN